MKRYYIENPDVSTSLGSFREKRLARFLGTWLSDLTEAHSLEPIDKDQPDWHQAQNSPTHTVIGLRQYVDLALRSFYQEEPVSKSIAGLRDTHNVKNVSLDLGRAAIEGRADAETIIKVKFLSGRTAYPFMFEAPSLEELTQMEIDLNQTANIMFGQFPSFIELAISN